MAKEPRIKDGVLRKKTAETSQGAGDYVPICPIPGPVLSTQVAQSSQAISIPRPAQGPPPRDVPARHLVDIRGELRLEGLWDLQEYEYDYQKECLQLHRNAVVLVRDAIVADDQSEKPDRNDQTDPNEFVLRTENVDSDGAWRSRRFNNRCPAEAQQQQSNEPDRGNGTGSGSNVQDQPYTSIQANDALASKIHGQSAPEQPEDTQRRSPKASGKAPEGHDVSSTQPGSIEQDVNAVPENDSEGAQRRKSSRISVASLLVPGSNGEDPSDAREEGRMSINSLLIPEESGLGTLDADNDVSESSKKRKHSESHVPASREGPDGEGADQEQEEAADDGSDSSGRSIISPGYRRGGKSRRSLRAGSPSPSIKAEDGEDGPDEEVPDQEPEAKRAKSVKRESQ